MVRFWDTSALVPLVLEEAASTSCRRLLRQKSEMVVWSLTRTEMTSALWRRCRGGDIASADMPRAIARVHALAKRWTEVTDLDLVRDRAERLLAVHTLRAADALQLGAALIAVGDRPRDREMIAADGDLVIAARAEGFTVLVPR